MPVAATKSNEILEGLNSIRRRGKFIDKKNNLNYLRLDKSVGEHIKINPTEGWTLRAMLASCVGDSSEADSCIKKALMLPMDDVSIKNIISTYSAINLRHKMADVFKKYASPEKGYFSSLFPFGISSGALITAAEYISIAEEKGYVFENELLIIAENIKSSSDVLLRNGIDEEYVVNYIELAGSIYIEKGEFFSPVVTASVNDIDDVLTIRFIVKGGVDEAFDLNRLLAYKEIESGIEKYPCINFVFSARRQ